VTEPAPIIGCIAQALSRHEPPLIHPGFPGDERIAFYEALAERARAALEAEGFLAERPGPLPPLLKVIFNEMRARGWTLHPEGGYVDPEGNLFFGLEDAISAQCFREIAQQPDSSAPSEQ
jgi:hypothetical protein